MVFKSDEQITTTCTSKAHIQTLIEQPMVYLIALNSSSIDDQVAIIPDRVECLYDLSEPIVSSNGIKVCDILKFFTGDHPAQQFERGTQHSNVEDADVKTLLWMIRHMPYDATPGNYMSYKQ